MMRTSLLFSLAATWAVQAQTVDIKGRVLDKANNKPIPGAAVKVLNSSLTATTDTAGRFNIKGNVTALRDGGQAWMAAPYFRDGAWHVQAPEDGRVATLEVFSITGESLASARHTLKAGWNRLSTLVADRDFLGFARLSLGQEVWIKRILRVAGHVQTLDGALSAASPASSAPGAGLAKTAASAAGQVEVTMAKLQTKTVPYATDVQDLGDIVMDYPARKLDVGAPPIYGASVLFDGSKGKAAAQAELTAKWQDWPRYTPSEIKFKLAKDPEFPNDTNRVTLQSCCNTLWGYDDIQAKEVHGDAQLHVEWMGMGQYDQNETPDTVASTQNKTGVGYINSGVYVQSRYEIQIETPGVSDAKHTMASLVDDFASDLQTPNRGNGKWQCYDVTFRAARYNASGVKTDNARITVWWNGVKVHDNRDATAPATGLGNHSGEEMNPTLYGLKLQSEGRDVRFRNVWIKHLVIPTLESDFGY